MSVGGSQWARLFTFAVLNYLLFRDTLKPSQLITRSGLIPPSPVGRILRYDNEVVADSELARAPASHAGGHWFKSSTVHHGDQRKCWSFVFFGWCPGRQLAVGLPFSSVP